MSEQLNTYLPTQHENKVPQSAEVENEAAARILKETVMLKTVELQFPEDEQHKA